MLTYTNRNGTIWNAIEIRDEITYHATEAAEDNPGSKWAVVDAVRKALDSLGLYSNDAELIMVPNSRFPDVVVRFHPGEIRYSWDPRIDGYEYPDSGDDAAELND